jgi:hypothetical protein
MHKRARSVNIRCYYLRPKRPEGLGRSRATSVSDVGPRLVSLVVFSGEDGHAIAWQKQNNLLYTSVDRIRWAVPRQLPKGEES